MRGISPRFGLLIFILLVSGHLAAQKGLSSSTDQQLLAHRYKKSIGVQSGIINGRDYLGYEPVGDEHPYFEEDEWATGSVVYDNIVYDSVELRYDLEKDVLVYEHDFNGQMVQLVSDKVNSFRLRGHTFEFLNFKKGDFTFEGFYDLIYSGRSKAYVKRTKSFQKRYSSTTYDPNFTEKNNYYIFLKSDAYRIGTMSDLVKALGLYGTEARKLVRKQHLNFKRNPDQVIGIMLGYYDQQTR